MYYPPKTKKQNHIKRISRGLLMFTGLILILNTGIDYLKSLSTEEEFTNREAQVSLTGIHDAVKAVSSADNDIKNSRENNDSKTSVSENPASQSDIESLIRQEFGEEAEIAIAVAKAESSMRPDCVGDVHLSKPSVGLFQISQIYHEYSTEELKDPVKNIKIAKEISSKGRGWENWTTYRDKTYLKYYGN